jgi:hypothetical protein
MEKEIYDIYLENLVLIRLAKELITDDLKSKPQETQLNISVLVAAEQLLNVAEEEHMLHMMNDTNSKSTIEQELEDLKIEIMADKNRGTKRVVAAFKLYYKTLDIAENEELLSFILVTAREFSPTNSCNTNAA